MADWAPELGLYAYAAQNTVVMLNSRAQTVRTMLSGHAGRCVGCKAHACSCHPPWSACMPDDAAHECNLHVLH